MPTCRLCHRDKALRFSHIVPEFLYADLYNEKRHMMGINGRGTKGWKPLQQGIREHLFCERCEQHFNGAEPCQVCIFAFPIKEYPRANATTQT